MNATFIFLFRSSAPVMDKIELVLSRYAPGFSNFVKVPFYLVLDLFESVKYGSGAPKKYELLYLRTNDVARGYKVSRPHHFGVVRYKYWDLDLVAVDDACGGIPGIARRKVTKEEPWEECGELERVIAHRKKSGKSEDPKDEDFQRFWNGCYAQLDSLIAEVRETGRLRTMAEFLTSRRFRERGGIGVCLDSAGEPILTDGHHRFGIMKGLQIDKIPVTLHAIHPGFMNIPDWRERLNRLRTDGE